MRISYLKIFSHQKSRGVVLETGANVVILLIKITSSSKEVFSAMEQIAQAAPTQTV